MTPIVRVEPGQLLCQVCGALNSAEESACRRCGQPLLVVSGARLELEDPLLDSEDVAKEVPLDEHLLERISTLEEALRRATEAVKRLSGVVETQERQLLVLEAGLFGLRDLLEIQGSVTPEEWAWAWRSRVEGRLRLRARRKRFRTARERIVASQTRGSEQQFERCLQEVERAFAEGDAARAERALERASRLDPDNLELLLLRAYDALEAGDLSLAERAFGQVRDQGEGGVGVSLALGLLAQEQGNSARARALFEEAVGLAPDCAIAQLALGAEWLRSGELTRAREHLGRAVELERSPQALLLFGKVQRALGETRRAVAALEEAVRLDPDCEAAFYELGRAYLDRKWSQKAREAFREALRLNPRSLRYQDLVEFLARGIVLPLDAGSRENQQVLEAVERTLASGRTRRALELLAARLEVDPHNEALLLRYATVAAELADNAQVEAATSRLLACCQQERIRAAATAVRIQALRAERRFPEANQLAALLIRSRSPVIAGIGHYELAVNLAEEAIDLDRALASAQQAQDLLPEELGPYAMAAIGWVEFRRGCLKSARTHLEQAFKLTRSRVIAAQLASVLLEEGEDVRARELLGHAATESVGGLEQLALEELWETHRLLAQAKRRRRIHS